MDIFHKQLQTITGLKARPRSWTPRPRLQALQGQSKIVALVVQGVRSWASRRMHVPANGK